MKITIFKRESDGVKDIKEFEVNFLVRYFKELSKKDEEKIYRVVRIIDSLGNDDIEETSDKDYRFQTDNDEGENLLDGVVVKGGSE
ncbi:MAG: hypothetical protein ACOX0X_01810 [Candidatus Dojkabacteria bacterium]